MKRSAYILLLMAASLMIEPLGPWQARGKPVQLARKDARRIAGEVGKSHRTLTVTLDEGAFVLQNLRLFRMGGSTRLEGRLINQTKQRREAFVFAVKAYDKIGRQLKGVEDEVIFSVNQLGRGKSTSINSGYGVWLEGIPFDNIARLEVVLLEDEPGAAHRNARKRFADIEE